MNVPDATGLPYIWPDPTAKSERWRFKAIRSCNDVLKNPPCKYDPEQELLQGYQATLKTANAKISEVLEMVGPINQVTRNLVSDLCSKAVDMWILFGTQPYRLQVKVYPFNLESASKKARRTELKLITKPELLRSGNSNGVALEEVNVVIGGNPDLTTYSRSR